jgi:hypothetical protein
LDKAEELLEMNVLYGRWKVEKKKAKPKETNKKKLDGKVVD